MKIIFCWDDGSKEDLQLIELHKKYNIPGMFFVPTRNIEGREVISEKEIFCASRDEIISFGCHTKNHVYLNTIPQSEIVKEVLSNKEFLEKSTGKKIIHFCYPGGVFNKLFTTTRSASTGCFKVKKNKTINPSIHFYPRGKLSLAINCLKNLSFAEFFIIILNLKIDYFELIKLIIKKLSKKTKKTIIIWGHSWELEEKQLWKKLEDLMRYVTKNYNKSICKYDDLITTSKHDIL